MLILIFIFTLLHAMLYIGLSVEWDKIELHSDPKNTNTFSVIIPVRNEVKNISDLLQHLEKQFFSKSNFEVIVINDFSEDETVEVVEDWMKKSQLDLHIISLSDEEKQGKKHALTLGVKEAKYPIILTTDADCTMKSDWITSYNEVFNEGIQMVAGPVGIVGKGMFARFQQAEFAGLIGFGAVTISRDSPAMCSGANLGFRKSVFEEVKGYEDNLFTPSGDDEFMLHSVMSRYPNSALFLKDERAVVETPAQESWHDLKNQRTRWSSKWKHNRNAKIKVLAILFFADYLSFYVMLLGFLLGWVPLLFVITTFMIRLLADYNYLSKINAFLGGKSIFLSVLFLQILYPAHVLLMGMSSIFGNYTWKGRRYR